MLIFEGSATKGQFQKCGSTAVFQITTPNTSGQGRATRLWNPNKDTFFKLTLYHGPLISSRTNGAAAKVNKFDRWEKGTPWHL